MRCVSQGRFRELIQRLQRFRVINMIDASCRNACALPASERTPTAPYEVLIAGKALARGLVLFTHKTEEFRRIASVQVQDWEI